MVIDGQKIAQEILEELKIKFQKLPPKIFAAVIVGENPANLTFLNQKQKFAKELDIDFRIYKYASDITNDKLRKEIVRISKSSRVGGVIVQLPLPTHLNRQAILNAINKEKDIDCLSERSLGGFYTSRWILPPAVGTVEKILENINYELTNKKAAVVGAAGFLVGKPISIWLMDKVAELYLFEKNTRDLKKELKEVDLIITGVGKAGLIKPEMLKEGAGVIDFGYSIDENGKIHGDFDTTKLINSSTHQLNFYTPTPGGTGPILVAQIFSNFYTLVSNTAKQHYSNTITQQHNSLLE